MLEELVLMRHAHAAHPSGCTADIERPLSATGQAEALAAGAWLQANIPMPDAVLCSSAVRTRQTLAGLVQAGCRLPAVEFEPRIYEATPGDLLALIDARLARAPALARLWLIGHNPGLEQLLHHFDAQAGLHSMPPATIARLGFAAAARAGAPIRASLLSAWTP